MAVETPTQAQLEQRNEFTRRHVGPDTAEQQAMLAELGLDSLQTLIEHTVPDSIRLDDALAMNWDGSKHC